MLISFIEIQNFRKLKSVRIDFSEKTTIFVGANNSGKTSAMLALSYFLIDSKRFNTNDFNVSLWHQIVEIGKKWEADEGGAPDVESWSTVVPAIDVWLKVEQNEIHHVKHLVPTLNWNGGLLGVRLRYEPVDVSLLKKDYLISLRTAKETFNKAATQSSDKKYSFSMWPQNLKDFLEKKLHIAFEVNSYLLDPSKHVPPENGLAKPQILPIHSEKLDINPLAKIIKINEIAAQRGLGSQSSVVKEEDVARDGQSRERQKLSEHLRSYYSKHLDPFDHPDVADLDALEAIDTAQKTFDDRLKNSFSDALRELEELNYPGFTDPKMKITTKLRPTDGLNHSAAVQYQLSTKSGADIPDIRLPEEYNGLGYQNLILMIFKLMSFRDSWMRVGKAERSTINRETVIPPLHLVLIEEPEAHLHAQVQQVFIRKAYDVLRKHKDLGESSVLTTQLVISTHSSNIAHEAKFSWLRYFRRMPAIEESGVPSSVVINLSEVFGKDDETEKFVTRYLKSTHCDLFFADAAIFVEGASERILVPYFIREKYEKLNRCFITILEIGGSHSQRLKKLIDYLGLLTLIITDIDSVSPDGHHKFEAPERGKNLITGNNTLKEWHPKKEKFDELIALSEDAKVNEDGKIPHYSVRVAYQIPVNVKNEKTKNQNVEVLVATFEDSLIFENLEKFKALESDGIVEKIKTVIIETEDIKDLSSKIVEIVRKMKKAEFALELLWLKQHPNLPSELVVPKYIGNGLNWLESKLNFNQSAPAISLEKNEVVIGK